MKKIAIFASGSGSNAEKIMEYFEVRKGVKVVLLLSNNPNAGALDHAKKFGVQTHVFDKETFKESKEVIRLLRQNNVDLVILAGFLWLIPEKMVRAFPKRIINIHPALLPKYGGKGMYGMHVHLAVTLNKEKESGITIHYVNKKYDEGDIIFQESCKLKTTDTPIEVAQKVLKLEHEHFPRVIFEILKLR